MDFRALEFEEIADIVETNEGADSPPLERNLQELQELQENYEDMVFREEMNYRIYRHSFTGRRRKRW